MPLMKLHAHFSGELPALLNLLLRSCLPSQGCGDPATFGRGGRGAQAGEAGGAEGRKKSSSGPLGLEWECLWSL